ncbi:hypothetical protein [Klebsiella pneumoniae]|uniref:hypothetical protein n=2 Tax=Klebsiella pneumoniae TaxID=573 RepID=UPI00294A0D23|nr:hypothetical protein [Klebsiella pneumoniae]MDV5550480.1 hypothetical protein [Klebsiella pneumoniae]
MVDALPSIPLPTCMVEAAQIYHIPLRGFLALWLTEGGKPGMKNKNKNGTYDYGAFQINTIWANKLASDFGVKGAAAAFLRLCNGQCLHPQIQHHSQRIGRVSAAITPTRRRVRPGISGRFTKIL